MPKKNYNGENRCQGNVKTCRKNLGGCGYRFKKGDVKWQDGGACPRCGQDRRCGRIANDGMRVCQVHGGGSPNKGRKGGRPPIYTDIFKPDLPQNILGMYRTAIEDDRLYQLKSDIAILEARKHILLKDIEDNVSAETWKQLRGAWSSYEQALASQNIEKMKESLFDVGQLIKKGYGVASAWMDVEMTIERKSRLIEKEVRHMETAHRMVSIEKLMTWADLIADSIIDRVKDPVTQKRLLGDIYESMNLGGGQAIVELPDYSIREIEEEE